jgi:hypothetical protein
MNSSSSNVSKSASIFIFVLTEFSSKSSVLIDATALIGTNPGVDVIV